MQDAMHKGVEDVTQRNDEVIYDRESLNDNESQLSEEKHVAENEQLTDDEDSQNMDITDLHGEREKDEIRVVMIGRTGAGKSATGNTILGKKEFVSKVSASSVTDRCKIGESRYSGRKLLFVDTPGLFDTQLPQGEVTKEIIRCIHMSSPGPHIFLLVLRVDRFTNEEIQTFNSLFEIFGEQMNKFAIVTFTRLDDLEQDNVTLQEFLDGSNQELKDFVARCEHRCIAFNNRSSQEEKQEKKSELINLINEILSKNNGEHYTNAMYKEAEANLQRKIKEVTRLKELEKEKEVELIESKFKGTMTEMEENSKKLKEQLSDQQQKTAEIIQEKEETNASLQNIQRDMMLLNTEHDKEKLKMREEEKKRTEIQLEKMRAKELEFQRVQNQQIMTNQKMKDMEKEKLESMKSIQTMFDNRMQESIKSVIKSNNEHIEVLQKEWAKKKDTYEKQNAEKDTLYQKIDRLQDARHDEQRKHQQALQQMQAEHYRTMQNAYRRTESSSGCIIS